MNKSEIQSENRIYKMISHLLIGLEMGLFSMFGYFECAALINYPYRIYLDVYLNAYM